MALIKCHECKNQVSDLASACPKCGAPIADKSSRTPINTIQKTSKELKRQQLFSGTFFWIGMIMLIFNGAYASYSQDNMSPVVVIFFVIGLSWHVVVKYRVWWHHK